jgi:integrase/recombinase XerD
VSRTIKRRLASVSGLFGYLQTRDDVAVTRNPVPQGLSGRRATSGAQRGLPLLRTPRTLPRVLAPVEVDALLAELRTRRDRAMVLAMLLGGLRRCETLGLRLGDLSPGERRVFIAEGKGGHQRIVPLPLRFIAAAGEYLDAERPAVEHDRLFVALRGPTRGEPDRSRLGRGAGRGPAPGRPAAPDLPPAAAHLPDPIAGGGDGAGGGAGPGRAPLD